VFHPVSATAKSPVFRAFGSYDKRNLVARCGRAIDLADLDEIGGAAIIMPSSVKPRCWKRVQRRTNCVRVPESLRVMCVSLTTPLQRDLPSQPVGLVVHGKEGSPDTPKQVTICCCNWRGRQFLTARLFLRHWTELPAAAICKMPLLNTESAPIP
jgi:hypothetical protein